MAWLTYTSSGSERVILRTLTLNGLDHTVVGIAPAALRVLTNGDILQASTQVLGVFIDGKPLPPTSKQARLYERYLERLEEVRSGRAPLGTK